MEVADVSFTVALQRLDAVRGAFTDRFLAGNVSVWAGSMLSFRRYPDLGKLLTDLLDNLHTLAADPTDPNDPARWTLDQILDRSGVAVPDRSARFSSWTPTLKKSVIGALWPHYSSVLGIRYAPPGPPQSILWDVLHIDTVYDDPAVDPDAEHRLLALLVLEGTLTSLVTTNWDPLIEDAHRQAAPANGAPPLHTIVRPADVTGTGGQPSLTKMHGCARTARQDPAAREFVVGTEQQVIAWPLKPGIGPIRDIVTTTARAFEVLYLGLSGQDLNIQQQHIQSALFAEQDYDAGNPRVVFAHGTLDETKGRILEAAYGTDTYNANYQAIRDDALVPLFAKPLLGGLFAFVLREKLYAYADANPPHFRPIARQGIDALVQHVASAADAIPDPDGRWRYISKTVARYVSSFNCLFATGIPLGDPWTYHPLKTRTTATVDPNDRRLALLIGILATGARDRRWDLEFTPEAPEQLRIHTAAGDVLPVYILGDKDVSPNLANFTSPDTDCLIINTEGNATAPPASRSPHAYATVSSRAGRVARARDPASATPSNQVFELHLNDWTAGTPPDPVRVLHLQLYDLGLVNHPDA